MMSLHTDLLFVLAAVALTFTLVKWVGAAYLIYLGPSALLEQGGTAGDRWRGERVPQGSNHPVAGFSEPADRYRACLLLGLAHRGVRRNQSASQWLQRELGGLFVAPGLRIAIERI